MFEQIEMISQMPVRSGKTTAICKAAKEINATVLVHSVGEARRVEMEHDVKARSINEEIRGSRGPYLIDTHAVSFMAIQFNRCILNLQSQLKKAEEKIAELDYRREAVVVLSEERIAKLEADLQIAREALELAAPHHQGMHSKVGIAIREALEKLTKT
jgi:hypothetical protein